MEVEHPLRPGVTVIVTRHLGPYRVALRGEMSLAEAAQRSAVLDRLAAGVEDESFPDANPPSLCFLK
ncbi:MULTISPECIES: hypothetical protein [unclassified Micromonospora]|uniref:hypothetical protein n=1 Tax=unclassified Micromonospora TaxID=2617518 RepID=UPI003326BA85